MSDLDQITALVSTSPIPSHPSTAIIAETLMSLPMMVRTIIMADGVRAEQEDRREDYQAYVHRLTGGFGYDVLQSTVHRHQAGMTSEVLDRVTTPYVLFVEHDTPIMGDIPWVQLANAIGTGCADVIRLASEASVLPEWEYLMVGKPTDGCGPRMWRTAQWSQRPHLASADWYRRILAKFFEPGQKAMIEDVFYTQCATPWVERKVWGEECKLWLYYPEGESIQRSYHLDGRAGDPKWPMS